MGWLDPSPGVLLEPCGDARPRGMVVHDRTRLNGRLRHFLSRALVGAALAAIATKRDAPIAAKAAPTRAGSGHLLRANKLVPRQIRPANRTPAASHPPVKLNATKVTSRSNS